MSRHSFSLSLSRIANGDINQSVDTHTEAVMCPHAGVSRDRQRWMTHPDAVNFLNRKIISRMQFKQMSFLAGAFLTELLGERFLV